MTEVALPRRIPAKARRWHKGLFVAANVKHVDGEPRFGQVNSEWVMEAMFRRVCQLCGQHISDRIPCVFPGGEYDFKYTEAPLHIDCCRYSMSVCPRILSRRETFIFHVCKSYEVRGWDDPDGTLVVDGAVPRNVRRGSTLALGLDMAHLASRQTWEWTCGHRFLQRLSYDEFMRWSEP